MRKLFVVVAVLAATVAFSLAAPGIASAVYMDTWILPISHREGSGWTTLTGAGYNGTDAYSGSGFDGVRRAYWTLSGVSDTGRLFPTTTELYKIEFWAPTQGNGAWQPIESQFKGSAGETYPIEPLIPWAGNAGTNHQWIGSSFSEAARGTWVATGPGPQVPNSTDYNAGANGTSMWLTGGSYVYAKWNFGWDIDRAWSALRVTQMTPVPQIYTWNGSTDTDWSVPGNWSAAATPSGPDGIGTSVIFGTAGSPPVVDLFGADRTVGQITFNGEVATTIQSTSLPINNLILSAGAGNAVVLVNPKVGTPQTHVISVPLRLDSSVNVAVTNGSDQLTVNGTISGIGGITLTGTSAGTLNLTGVNINAGETTVNGGTLVADTTINATILNPASALTLGGGTFQLKGAASSVTQIVNGLNVNPGASVVDANNLNPGVSTTLNLSGQSSILVVNRNVGGTVDFKASNGTLGTDALILPGTLNTDGILGAWATVKGGADFAANSSNDLFGSVVAYTGYTDIAALGSEIADGPTSHVRINSAGTTGAITLGATTTNIHTLMQNAATAATVDTAGKTLRLGVIGGILLTPSGQALTIGAAANSGVLTAGGNAADVAGELILNNSSSNTLTVNAVIADNGLGAVTLTRSGSGLLILAGDNTYTGPTYLNAGTTAISSNANLGAVATGGQLYVSGGTLQLMGTGNAVTLDDAGANKRPIVLGGKGGAFDVLDGNALTISGVISGSGSLTKTASTGSLTLTGVNTYTGTTTLTAGTLSVGVTANLGDAASNLVFDGGTLRITGTTLASVSGIGHMVSFNATKTVGLDIDNAAHTFTVDQVLNQGTGGFTKLGAGTAILNQTNTYTGTTAVSAGTLQVTASIASSSVTVAPSAVLDLANTTGTALAAVTPYASVTNDGTMNVSSLSEQAGAISGIGSTSVTGSLTADSIVQNTLTIGAGGSVTIRETVVGGNASPVPEPGTWVLLATALVGLLALRRRRAA